MSTAPGPPLQPPGSGSTSPCRGLWGAEHALIRLGKDGVRQSSCFEFTAARTRLSSRGSLTSVSQDGIGEVIHGGEIKDQSMSRRHSKQVLVRGGRLNTPCLCPAPGHTAESIIRGDLRSYISLLVLINSKTVLLCFSEQQKSI